jgi:hypothetical protein
MTEPGGASSHGIWLSGFGGGSAGSHALVMVLVSRTERVASAPLASWVVVGREAEGECVLRILGVVVGIMVGVVVGGEVGSGVVIWSNQTHPG